MASVVPVVFIMDDRCNTIYALIFLCIEQSIVMGHDTTDIKEDVEVKPSTDKPNEESCDVPTQEKTAANEDLETQKSQATGEKSKQKGPAGFSSAEDLMHRLFVAISGVADQLQTNHARDFRVILKHVFLVCQSEPEECDFREPTSPCTPQPTSPLDLQSQSE